MGGGVFFVIIIHIMMSLIMENKKITLTDAKGNMLISIESSPVKSQEMGDIGAGVVAAAITAAVLAVPLGGLALLSKAINKRIDEHARKKEAEEEVRYLERQRKAVAEAATKREEVLNSSEYKQCLASFKSAIELVYKNWQAYYNYSLKKIDEYARKDAKINEYKSDLIDCLIKPDKKIILDNILDSYMDEQDRLRYCSVSVFDARRFVNIDIDMFNELLGDAYFDIYESYSWTEDALSKKIELDMDDYDWADWHFTFNLHNILQ